MSTFELIPAIDLLGGKCVRLSQGEYDRSTVYAEDPATMAEKFAAANIQRLHVVDLDGAKAGTPKNTEAIRRIVSAMGGIPVELGGGIRTFEAVESTLALGVDRVILGTVALRDPELVRRAAAQFPGRVVVGIDAREGRVATQGWLEDSEISAAELAQRFEDAGVAAIIYTDIARDGMLTGPNLEATAALADQVQIPVIVSGGVSSVGDIRAASEMASHGIAGIIVGRALYTGAVALEEALEVVRCC